MRIGKTHTFLCNFIDVWRRYFAGTITAQIAISHIVGKYKYNVRVFSIQVTLLIKKLKCYGTFTSWPVGRKFSNVFWRVFLAHADNLPKWLFLRAFTALNGINIPRLYQTHRKNPSLSYLATISKDKCCKLQSLNRCPYRHLEHLSFIIPYPIRSYRIFTVLANFSGTLIAYKIVERFCWCNKNEDSSTYIQR